MCTRRGKGTVEGTKEGRGGRATLMATLPALWQACFLSMTLCAEHLSCNPSLIYSFVASFSPFFFIPRIARIFFPNYLLDSLYRAQYRAFFRVLFSVALLWQLVSVRTREHSPSTEATVFFPTLRFSMLGIKFFSPVCTLSPTSFISC